MPSKCSFCKAEGHNIRTCNDPRIGTESRNLLGRWCNQELYTNSQIRLTPRACGILKGYINEISPSLIRAMSVRLCHQRANNSIVKHIIRLIKLFGAITRYLNRLNREQREEWCMKIFRMPITSLYEMHFYDSHGHWPDEPERPKPKYEILFKPEESQPDMKLECVICQTEQSVDNFLKTQCSHSFCHGCICSYVKSKCFNRASCPLCRTNITSFETTGQECYDLSCNRFGKGASV